MFGINIISCFESCSYIWQLTKCNRNAAVGMAILPRPAWPAPPRFAPCGFSRPCKGDGARMGQDFRPAPRGGAGTDLHFLDPPRPIPAPH